MNIKDKYFDIYTGKSILVTGATGSFGRKFVQTLFEHANPARVVVFSRDELKQYEMAQQFPEDRYPIRYFIGDVRDRERLIRACNGIDLIVHAAAMKHILAAEYNPTECIATNILGAQNVIDAAIENNVKQVVALSTDKAANPINLYGATKLCSDRLFIAGNNLSGKTKTRFSVVRYGNVAGSRGSVIPHFKQMAANGETEFPITHADMTRFVITLADGVQLVNLAMASMEGGEIFVPKLPSVKITDIIPHLCADATYKIIGIRPGEKLHEVMIPYEESRNAIDMGDYYILQPTLHWWNTKGFMEKIEKYGKPVSKPFEYDSGSNDDWMTGDQILELINSIDL
ncbi:UDP-N-acetylglucosamine 4,6-dehydratase (inverting) [Kiloniella sp. EL199]|uniref:UDP-N-acetylglucosamine 4,6-dehydratase (inverting) n=1 Tax=Kiloniella sp. EL199 TaxID=2107581 RepID=UPI0020B106E6|nr:UDP-N-acetylglucosamine 4,6-dehydratase (inverting) [Kiloniella sp. EL199]